MSEPTFSMTADDDLPRTIRRERDAREREARERHAAASVPLLWLTSAAEDGLTVGTIGRSAAAFDFCVAGGKALKATRQIAITPQRANTVPKAAITRKIFAEPEVGRRSLGSARKSTGIG
jgi:hypothetical protein